MSRASPLECQSAGSNGLLCLRHPDNKLSGPPAMDGVSQFAAEISLDQLKQ